MNRELEEQLELDALIEEQQKDDSSVMFGEQGHENDISIEGLENHLVRNEDGEPEVLVPPHPVPSGTGHLVGRVKGSVLVGGAPYHGTTYGYWRMKCRCSLCRQARREAARKLRAKKATT